MRFLCAFFVSIYMRKYAIKIRKFEKKNLLLQANYTLFKQNTLTAYCERIYDLDNGNNKWNGG